MRTPENFELTNAQEFGSSWAAIEVKCWRMIYCSLLPKIKHQRYLLIYSRV